MKTILSINASFQVRGGADRLFVELNRLMIDKGDRVVTFTYKPKVAIGDAHPNYVHYFIDKELYPNSVLKTIIGIIRAFYAPRILKDLERIIEKEKPVIAHIHNIYHRIPYDILNILHKHGVRSVWWLHDYKWRCPNHQLYTQGNICKKCKDGNYFKAVKYRCHLDSFLKSSITCFFAYFVSANKYINKVDMFIAPSLSVYSLFKEFNFPISIVKVLPHFNYGVFDVEVAAVTTKQQENPFALYVGRIEKNKGRLHLVRAFGESGYPLKIIGTGNYEIELKKYCIDNKLVNVEFSGYIPPDRLSGYYYTSLFVVVPSVWYEVFGLSVLESFNHAKPVVASAIGAIPEIVENMKTGLLFKPGDVEDLCKRIKWMFENPESAREMGLNAQKFAADHYSPEKYWEELQRLQKKLLND